MKSDVIVVGGGAAGLLCAAFAAERGRRVTVLEHMDRPARKLMITGKGRCNLTNNCSQDDFIGAVKTNGRFLYSAYSAFSAQDVMELFQERLGVPLKTERGSRVYPQSDKSVDIVDALVGFAKDNGAVLRQAKAARLLLEDSRVVGVADQDGREYRADSVVLATGGVSYPLTGSTGDGYALAKQAGHTIVPLRPSLIPVVSREQWCRELMGLSLKNVTLRAEKQGKAVFEGLGEMLFTHFGVSGPLVLSASTHMSGELSAYRLLIDLKPGLTREQLDARLLRDFGENPNKDLANTLGALLPRKLIPVMIQLCGMDGQMKIHQITKEQRTALVERIKGLVVTPASFRPIGEAVVTSGGVKVSEVSPKTMESKVMPGLYFAGELLDVDAYTGGYNLQVAFSTAYVAGQNA